MIYSVIDYFLASSLVLLPVLLLWRHIDQPARRVVLGRIALLLLLLCVPILAWPQRPAISLQKQPTQTQPIVETVIFEDAFLKPERFFVEEPYEAIHIPVTDSSPIEVSVVSPVTKQASSVTATSRETQTTVPFSATDICNAIVMLYVSGAAVLGLWFLCGVMRLFRLVGKSENVPAEILELFHGVTGKSNRVSVVLHRNLASPIVWGTFWPGIVLPAFLCDTEVAENNRGLRFALAHEWHHIRNGDLWCLALCRVLALFLYPNPLFWMLISRIREEQEILADAAATAAAATDDEAWERRREYALELVRWSRMAASQPSNLATASAALAICEFGKTKQKTSLTLERRIDMLLQNDTVCLKTSGLWKTCCAIVLGCMVSFMTLFTLQPGEIAVAQNSAQKATKKDESVKPETKSSYDIGETFKVTVIDEQGKPAVGVEMFLNIWGGEIEKTYQERINSDENGVVVFDLTPIRGKKFEPFRLWAKGAGYVPLFVNWDRMSAPYRPIPEEVTITVEKALEYSGRVVDEQGNSINGVDVSIVGPGGSSEPNKANFVSQSPWVDTIKTDVQGRWKSNKIPQKGNIRFGFKHPEHLNVEYGEYKTQDSMTPEKLLDGTAVYVMKRGISVTGTVTDPDGKPIPGVTVRIGSNDMINYSDNKAATTDMQGKYQIFWKAETCPIMASGEGKAPELKIVTVTKNPEPIDFVLEPGKTIKVKVVDQNKVPLAGVNLNPHRWRGTTRYFDDKLKGNDKTDNEGLWVWNEAPNDPVEITIYRRGQRSDKENYTLKPGSYTIGMRPANVAKGRVIDSVTKNPVPAFTISPGYCWTKDYGEPTLQPHSSQGYRDGVFEFEINRSVYGYNLRFTADGYLPHLSETFGKDETADITVELTPAESISAVVLLPDGAPAQDTEVALYSASSGTQLIRDAKIHPEMGAIPRQVTKADGRFTFQPQLESYVIVAIHDAGIAQVYADELKNGTINLQPWSRVEGVVKKGDKPWPGKNVWVSAAIDWENTDEKRPDIQYLYSTTSDENGKFHVDRLIPGRKIVASWHESYGRSPLDNFGSGINSDAVNFTSEPDKTTTVTIGGVGRPVTGKIIVTSGEYKDKIDWDFAEVTLKGVPENLSAPDYASLPVPENVDRNNSIAFNQWYYSWILKDEKGKEFQKKVYEYNQARPMPRNSRIAKDGTFRVENVPPGRYEFSVDVFQPKPLEDIEPAPNNMPNMNTRLRLNNTRREPIVIVPNFDRTVTDVPAELGDVKIDLRK